MGFFRVGGGGGGAAGSLAKIADTLLAADAATIDFQNIPGTYLTLQALISCRSDLAANNDGLLMRFNNDAGANYSDELIGAQGVASSASERIAQTSNQVGNVPGNTSLANDFSAGIIWIPGYASTTKNKPWVANIGLRKAAGSGLTAVQVCSGIWFNAAIAAITRITFLPSAGTVLRAGSRITLYGLS